MNAAQAWCRQPSELTELVVAFPGNGVGIPWGFRQAQIASLPHDPTWILLVAFRSEEEKEKNPAWVKKGSLYNLHRGSFTCPALEPQLPLLLSPAGNTPTSSHLLSPLPACA